MSHGDGLDRLHRALEEHGCTVRGTAAQCPAPGHDDRNASLSIGQGRDGAVLNCHAGCATDAVLEALSMSAADLFDEPRGRASSSGTYEVTATYTYTDEAGGPLFFAERRVPKDFRQYRVVNGRKVYQLGDVRRVLYRLPRVIEAAKTGQTVYVAEGEKDVHALEAAGAVATCNPMGAGKWRPEYSEALAGAQVVIVADRDSAGRDHAVAVADDLRGRAASVRIVEAAEGKDAADHLEHGHGLDGFRPYAESGRHAVDDSDGLAEIASHYTAVSWADAWSGQPDAVDWLLDEFLERGTANALFAKPGTGKSLLALEASVAIVRDGGTVMYVDDENRVTDVVERLQAFGCTPEELGRLRFYSFAGLPPLDTVTGGLHLLALAAINGADLVVLDTTTRMVAGRENDSDTFLQLYRCSLVPLKARGVTTLRLDHPGKDTDRGQRGSSAKDGDVDTVWRLEGLSPTRFRLEREKSRSGHGPGAFELTRRSEPLRHDWKSSDSASGLPEIAVRVLGILNAENIPLQAGRETVRAILAAHDIKISNSQLTATIRYRKNCPGQLPDSTDSGAGDRLSVRTPHRYGQADSTSPGPATPFHCETCGRQHPLGEHQQCREAAEAEQQPFAWQDDQIGAEVNR